MKPRLPNDANSGLAPSSPASAATWSVRRRALVSLFVAVHVSAVFAAPFATPPASDLGLQARAVLRPYIEAVDLDHGYRFFNVPGPSHRIRYRLEFADGRPPRDGVFPNLDEHQPRLRYHRHFMLTESAFNYGQAIGDPSPPPGVRAGTPRYETWLRERNEAEAFAKTVLKSYARHLMHVHGAERVTLYGLTRELPMTQAVLAGVRLDDPRYLIEERLDTYSAETGEVVESIPAAEELKR